MLNILFAAPKEWPDYADLLPELLAKAGLKAKVVSEACAIAPEEVDYIIYAPSAPLQDFTPYSKVKAVLSLWAGVERIVGNETLTQPLCRMVDEGLSEGMVEWVTGHVLRHHLGMDRHILKSPRHWAPKAPPLARDRRVVLLGLGALGQAVAQSLGHLNFALMGWSRSPKTLEGIECHHGPEGLKEVLRQGEIVITLLPRTAQTEGLLNQDTLALMRQGAVILNPGRGALIDDEALLQALDRGQIAHATLDVFRIEPLPQDHPFWAHPKVTVTPHIAAATRPETAARSLVENIRRGEAGEPFLHLVDRLRGY